MRTTSTSLAHDKPGLWCYTWDKGHHLHSNQMEQAMLQSSNKYINKQQRSNIQTKLECELL